MTHLDRVTMNGAPRREESSLECVIPSAARNPASSERGFFAALRAPQNDRVRARGERGQALIIAVLVMLILGALAGLFIIVVSWSLAQSVIEADRIGAQYLAEAGLRFANDQLTYGAEGADWRPAAVDPDNWAEYPYGDGKFRLRITYQPKRDDPLSKFIKIEAEGRRAAARHLLVAYKPIFITDYLRFVTNSDKSARRAQLGGPFFVYTTTADGKRTNMGPYTSFWGGVESLGNRTQLCGAPMHINGELEWFGPERIRLARGPSETPDRCAQLNDGIEVSRYILLNPEWQSAAGGAPPLTVSVNGGAPQAVGPTYLPSPPESAADTLNPQFTTVGGVYRDGLVAQTDINGFSRAAAYYEAPAIDLGIEGTSGHRYHALTRDSGEWLDSPSRQRYNTGWYGYGDGIYIDNFGDRDQTGGYEAWRQRWAAAAASGVYPEPPKGAVIWLHNDGTITIQRDDKDWVAETDPSQLMDRTVTMAYPRNGVIYAEGNVRIGGVLRASPRDFEFDPNAAYPGYWNSANYRRFDLTVVSGGTIYIEGALTSDASDESSTMNVRSSKIALLALENVCFDTTKVLRPVGPASLEWGAGEGVTVRPGQPYEAEFTTRVQGTSGIQLFLRHAGTFEPGGYATQMRLWIDGKLYEWGGSGGETTYWLYPTAPWADNSAPVVAPYWEAIPCTEPGVSKRIELDQYLNTGSTVHRIRFEAAGLDYHLYDLTIQPLTVNVDALVYAQRGSWYVLAGPWFDDGDEDEQSRLPQQINIDYGLPGQPGFPRPHEPSDINLVFRGAISENRTAPIGDALTWTQRWRGADEWWQVSDIGTDAPATHGLQYRYDPYLRLNVGDEANPVNRPRLPRLPVSPVLISVEETANL
jgi:hypothetical protein